MQQPLLTQPQDVEKPEHKKQHQEDWCCLAEAFLSEEYLIHDQAGSPAGTENRKGTQKLGNEQLVPRMFLLMQGCKKKGLLHIHNRCFTGRADCSIVFFCIFWRNALAEDIVRPDLIEEDDRHKDAGGHRHDGKCIRR